MAMLFAKMVGGKLVSWQKSITLSQCLTAKLSIFCRAYKILSFVRVENVLGCRYVNGLPPMSLNDKINPRVTRQFRVQTGKRALLDVSTVQSEIPKADCPQSIYLVSKDVKGKSILNSQLPKIDKIINRVRFDQRNPIVSNVQLRERWKRQRIGQNYGELIGVQVSEK